MNLPSITLTYSTSVFQGYLDFLSIKFQYDCTNGENLAQELQSFMVAQFPLPKVVNDDGFHHVLHTLNVSAFLGTLWKETGSFL